MKCFTNYQTEVYILEFVINVNLIFIFFNEKKYIMIFKFNKKNLIFFFIEF